MEVGGVRGVVSRKTSRGAKLPIVRSQIRLPRELSEKMPSAPCSPMSGRKGATEPLPLSKLVQETQLEEKGEDEDNQVVKSVASMVRRFELEATSDTKTRAGFLTTEDSQASIEEAGDDFSSSIDSAGCVPEVLGNNETLTSLDYEAEDMQEIKESTVIDEKTSVNRIAKKITIQSKSSGVVHSKVGSVSSRRGLGQAQTSPIDANLMVNRLHTTSSEVRLTGSGTKKLGSGPPLKKTSYNPIQNNDSSKNLSPKTAMHPVKKTSSGNIASQKSVILKKTSGRGITLREVQKNTSLLDKEKSVGQKLLKNSTSSNETNGVGEMRKVSSLANREKKPSRSIKIVDKSNGVVTKNGFQSDSAKSTTSQNSHIMGKGIAKSVASKKRTPGEHTNNSSISGKIVSQSPVSLINKKSRSTDEKDQESSKVKGEKVTANLTASENGALEVNTITENNNANVNNGTKECLDETECQEEKPSRGDTQLNNNIDCSDKTCTSEIMSQKPIPSIHCEKYSDDDGGLSQQSCKDLQSISHCSKGSESCDNTTVPSQNLPLSGSPSAIIDASQNLNIDGPGQTESFRLLGPISNQLEHELPESPAFRSPLLSDSETEPDQENISSRQQVLDAFIGTNEDQPSLRNKLLSNLVNKRSESDGIVTLDRPRPEAPVRRCESIDNFSRELNSPLMGVYQERTGIPSDIIGIQHEMFPNSIKTVTPATILKGPEDYTAGLQETVYLRAHYFGNPEPRVAWFKGGHRLSHMDRIKIRTYPGESTLVMRDLRADDSGKYEIQIENEVGCDECSASLCVEGPPEPPGGRPYITTIDRDTLKLTLAWYGSTFDGGSMLTGYIVEMSSWPITAADSEADSVLDSTDWTVLTSKCHSTSYIVKKLDPDREYIFRVRAQNIHGQSDPGKVCEPVSLGMMDDELDEDEEGRGGSDDEDFDSPFEHRQVTMEDGSIFKDKFDIYEELGRGRFGVVFKVKDKDTREVFAAKFVRCRKQEEREKCKEEISIMNGLDHSRLLQLAAAYDNPREVIMIMEFIGGGELFEKVVADDFTLTEHDCVLFMRQICIAIGYMHQKDIVHLDLKPENILCKSKKSHQIKIIDFGLTRKLKPKEDVRILFGTPEFVSPEVISYEPVSASSDMWSVGVVCYVLLSGLSPFMGDSDVETFSNITGLAYDFDDDAFEHISEDAEDFIQKLLVKDQRKRLKAFECLKHPWLNQQQSDRGTWKEINTDKLKSFLMRRRWQKAAHAIRALGRFTSLGFRQDTKDSASSLSALSTQSADF